MREPAMIAAYSGPCTIAGRSGRGLASVVRNYLTGTADDLLVMQPGLKECSGAVILDVPFRDLDEALGMLSDTPCEYVGLVWEEGFRESRATVYVTLASMRAPGAGPMGSWVQFVAAGPVP